MNLKALISVLLLASVARADDDVDPPSRVGQLSFVKGHVSFKPAASDDWVTAEINRPITIGDALWVDDDSRAEIHIGSLAIRLDQYTSVNVLALDDALVQLGLVRGRMTVTLRELDDEEHVEVDLPNAVARVHAAGLYVFSHDEERDATRIAVRRGNLDVTASSQTFDVDAGQSALVNGSGDGDAISYDLRRIASADAFEQFAEERDARDSAAVATRYVAPEMTGYQALDDYGAWATTPEYGHIWYPTTVSVGWAPYRSGHWTFIAPWGWTWVDDMPWGFAPFHYGRWVSWQGRWGWCPGARIARPVYAPALVAWTTGVNVGWFPLGPREVYVPGYYASPRYVQRVNVTHVSGNVVGGFNVTTYRYMNRPSAYSAVPEHVFMGARPVGPSLVRDGNAQVVQRLAVAPHRESYARTYLPAQVRPPQSVVQRPVMVMHDPVRMNAPSRSPVFNAPTRPAMPAQRMAPPRPLRENLPPTRPAERWNHAPSRSPDIVGQTPAYNSPSRQPQYVPQENAPSRQPQYNPPPQAPTRQPQAIPQQNAPSRQPQYNPPPQPPARQPQAIPQQNAPSRQPQYNPPPQAPTRQPQVIPPQNAPSRHPQYNPPQHVAPNAPSRQPAPQRGNAPHR